MTVAVFGTVAICVGVSVNDSVAVANNVLVGIIVVVSNTGVEVIIIGVGVAGKKKLGLGKFAITPMQVATAVTNAASAVSIPGTVTQNDFAVSSGFFTSMGIVDVLDLRLLIVSS